MCSIFELLVTIGNSGKTRNELAKGQSLIHMVLLFNMYYACVLYRPSVGLSFCLSKNLNLNNSANLGWIGEIDISTESGAILFMTMTSVQVHPSKHTC